MYHLHLAYSRGVLISKNMVETLHFISHKTWQPSYTVNEATQKQTDI